MKTATSSDGGEGSDVLRGGWGDDVLDGRSRRRLSFSVDLAAMTSRSEARTPAGMTSTPVEAASETHSYSSSRPPPSIFPSDGHSEVSSANDRFVGPWDYARRNHASRYVDRRRWHERDPRPRGQRSHRRASGGRSPFRGRGTDLLDGGDGTDECLEGETVLFCEPRQSGLARVSRTAI